MKRLIFLGLCFSPMLAFSQKNISSKTSVEWIQEGLKKYDEDKFYDAIQRFKKIALNDTNYATAQYELALSYVGLKEYFSAEKILKDLIKREVSYDNRSQAFLLLGQTYDAMKKYDLAEKAYDDGIKAFPMNHSLFFAKGVSYEQQERHQEALEQFKLAVQRNMNHASSHLRLGIIAAREGQFAQASMSLMTFLFVEPKSDRASSVVSLLEEIADGTYTPEPKNVVLSKAGDDFENINLFFTNKVALQPKYKVKQSIETAFGKQMHLILSNISYNKEDQGFWHQMYVPLFKSIFDANLLDPMILYSVQSVRNEKVAKKVASKQSLVSKFIKEGSDLWANHSSRQYIEFEGSKQHVLVIYQKSGVIMGKINDQSQSIGNWYYYHPQGNLNLTAHFDDKGNKVGKWVWRDFFTGNVSEEMDYVNNEKTGYNKFFYPSGELMQMRTLVKGVIQDTIYEYFRGGEIEGKITVKDDMRNGESTTYYENGQLKERITFVNGDAEGPYQSFHRNGQLEIEMNLVKNKIEGVRKTYFPNGQLETEYTYKNGERDGAFKTYYANGQLEESGTMIMGKMNGENIEYYSNGILLSKGTYDESGKENGTVTKFDTEGKKYIEFTFKKGSLEKIVTFDKDEKVVKTIEKSGKKIEFENYYATRRLNVKGTINNGSRDGLWKYYDNYGNLKTTEYYVNGQLEDTVVGYFANGKVSYKTTFRKGDRNGLYLSYNQHGELITEGVYLNDEPANDWYEYYDNGQLKEEFSFKDGDRHGIEKNYAVNGKLDNYTVYSEGKIISSVYLDTLQNEMLRFGEFNGQIKLRDPLNSYDRFVGNYNNGINTGLTTWYDGPGKKEVEGKYINSRREGTWTWYFLSGKVSKTVEYKNGEIHGKYIEYHENGKLKFEGTYVNGELEGVAKNYYDNGKLEFEATYFNGKRHGKATSYGYDGSVQQFRHYVQGALLAYSYLDKTGKEVTPIEFGKGEQQYTCYYQNGQKSVEQTRLNGILNGNYKEFYPSGKIFSDQTYVYGDQEGKATYYYENGNKKLESEYRYDELHGLEVMYYSNGAMMRSTQYLFGKRHGVCNEYNEAGKLIKTHFYYNDELISTKTM